MWVNWIQNERLKGKSIWTAKDTEHSSWSWRGILKQRDIMRRHCVSKIGNGKQTALLHDNWCNLSPLSNHISGGMLKNARIDDSVTVKVMVQNGVWIWPTGWVNRVPAMSMLAVPNLIENKEDKVVWINNAGNEVEFSVGNVWKDNRESSNKVQWGKTVWFSQNIPSHAFILWLAMKDRLQTHERMMKWNPANTYVCALCEKQHDSLDHLFFMCEYSGCIWKEIKEIMEDQEAPDKWQDITLV